MTKKEKRPLSFWLGAVTAGLLTVSGLCLMAGCLAIYRTGEFTPAAVAAGFRPIAPVCYAAVAAAIAGLFLPHPPARPIPARQTAAILARLSGKVLPEDLQALGAEIQAEQVSRRRRTSLRNALLGICAVVFLCYAVDGSHFHTSQINSSMIRAMTVLLPCLMVSLAASLWAHYGNVRSMEREISLWKQVPGKASPSQAPAPKKEFQIRYALLVLAAGLLVFGFCTGGTADVLTKAVNICTECVGLG